MKITGKMEEKFRRYNEADGKQMTPKRNKISNSIHKNSFLFLGVTAIFPLTGVFFKHPVFIVFFKRFF